MKPTPDSGGVGGGSLSWAEVSEPGKSHTWCHKGPCVFYNWLPEIQKRQKQFKLNALNFWGNKLRNVCSCDFWPDVELQLYLRITMCQAPLNWDFISKTTKGKLNWYSTADCSNLCKTGATSWQQRLLLNSVHMEPLVLQPHCCFSFTCFSLITRHFSQGSEMCVFWKCSVAAKVQLSPKWRSL